MSLDKDENKTDNPKGGILGKLFLPSYTDAGAGTSFRPAATLADVDYMSETATEIHDNRTSTRQERMMMKKVSQIELNTYNLVGKHDHVQERTLRLWCEEQRDVCLHAIVRGWTDYIASERAMDQEAIANAEQRKYPHLRLWTWSGSEGSEAVGHLFASIFRHPKCLGASAGCAKRKQFVT